MPKPRERRTVKGAEIRADKDSGKITGYAAMFDSPTVIAGSFREVIRPGAFKKTLSDGADVRALFNHDPNYVLGRNKAGTLQLTEDEKGLRYEIDPPDTQQGRDLTESIRRGDVSQSSFAFSTVQDAWRKDEDGIEIRELIEVELYDVSPVTYPAYEDTEVSVRNQEIKREDGSITTMAVLIDRWKQDTEEGRSQCEHPIEDKGCTLDMLRLRRERIEIKTNEEGAQV